MSYDNFSISSLIHHSILWIKFFWEELKWDIQNFNFDLDPDILLLLIDENKVNVEKTTSNTINIKTKKNFKIEFSLKYLSQNEINELIKKMNLSKEIEKKDF